jgi:cell wall-associated NlpC family hydrolase
VDFDYVLHSLIVAKRPATPGWWHRPTTIGAVAIVALCAAAASSSSVAPSPQKRAVARTYTASNWPDLLQRHAPSGTPPSTPSAVVPAPTGPVVGAVDLCKGANEPPNAALTGDTVVSNGASHHATVVLAGVATQSADPSGLNSLLPTITGATQGVTGALGVTIPSLPSVPSIPPLPDPTATVPPTTPSPGGSWAASGGTAAPSTAPAPTPSTSTTTPPTSGSPPSPTTGSPLPTQTGTPNSGGSDSSIGCDLIGSGTVGGMAPGETAAESSAVADAIALLGLPYVWGGESTQIGFDCSGMVQYVYREVGIDLPRIAQNQYDPDPPCHLVQRSSPVIWCSSGPGPTM